MLLLASLLSNKKYDTLNLLTAHPVTAKRTLEASTLFRRECPIMSVLRDNRSCEFFVSSLWPTQFEKNPLYAAQRSQMSLAVVKNIFILFFPEYPPWFFENFSWRTKAYAEVLQRCVKMSMDMCFWFSWSVLPLQLFFHQQNPTDQSSLCNHLWAKKQKDMPCYKNIR